MSNAGLYEERDRLVEELGGLNSTSQAYADVLARLTDIDKIIGDNEKRDRERNNDNIRNDIQEEELKVNKAKVRSDRFRTWASLILGGAQLAAYGGGMWYSYHQEGEKFSLVLSRTCHNIATKLADRIGKF